MLKRLIQLISIILSSSLLGADGDVLFSGFGTDCNLFTDNAKISDQGKTLEIDTFGKSGWQYALVLPNRLKAGGKYTVSFDINLKGEHNDRTDYLHFICRNKKIAGSELDAFGHNQHDTFGKTIRVRTDCEAPEDAEMYTIRFIAHKGIKAKITNFKIIEGTLSKFIPITENKKHYKLDKSTLPTGAKEFTVDLPNNPNGEVVEAKRFGVVPNKKLDVKLVNDAIAYCREKKASKLIFEKDATYYFGDGSISISDIKDFIFDGNGSTFIYRKKKGTSFRITKTERVVFENLNVDWMWNEEPLASLVRIKEISPATNKEDFYIDYEFVHYTKHPQHGQYLRSAVCTGWDEKNDVPGFEGALTLYGNEFITGKNIPEVKWVADNVMRILRSNFGQNRIQVGQYYRMQHYYYDMNHMYMYSNKHLTVRNHTVWSCTGHAFVMDGTQKYTHFDNVKIVRHKDMPKRIITCTADHFHFSRSAGYFKMENCDFSYGADDCINFHDCSSYGVKNSPKSIVSRHNYGGDGAVIELRNSDYSPTNFSAIRTHAKRLENGLYEIFFASDLPSPDDNQFIMFDKTYDTHNIIVRNSYFHHNRARGILILARDVTIEGCTFRGNERGAIKLETGYTHNIWCEGYGVNNIVIRNNVFDTSNPIDERTMGYARDIFMGVYLRTDPSKEQTTYPILSNILFEGNTFKDTFGMITTMGSTGNVTFHKNIFINETPRNSPLKYRGQFYMTHSSNVKIVNNKFLKSENTPNLGVWYESDSCKDIVVQGNKIVRSIKLNEK